MGYWRECISEAFDDAGITATAEQIDTVSSWVEGAQENYGMAHGHDAIPNPVIYEATRELERIKRKASVLEDWRLSTKPCKNCTTTGYEMDAWGREVDCQNCGGRGRHK